MRAAVLVFPGSNCDRDLARAFALAGFDTEMVWHKDTKLPDRVDIIGIPGGFSFGDYLRCGAIAANAPICPAIREHAERGGYVIGICNGFQILTELGLLPGALQRNNQLKFVCRTQALEVAATQNAFTGGYTVGTQVKFPIAHHDGNYTADTDTLDRLEAENRVALRYVGNPNGSARDIAGILSDNRRVLGLMPHPERAVEEVQGGQDGARLFAHLAGMLTPA